MKNPNGPDTTPVPDRLLRLPAVLEMVGLSRSAWWAGIARGRFPAGVRLTPRTRAWHERDIRALIESAPEAGPRIAVPRRRRPAKSTTGEGVAP